MKPILSQQNSSTHFEKQLETSESKGISRKNSWLAEIGKQLCLAQLVKIK